MRNTWTLLWVLGCGAPDTVEPAAVEDVVPEPPARCGDGVLVDGEGCDDGNALGGDGCLPDCTVESGALESEPNDAWDAAGEWPGEPVHGSLPEGDLDCFALDVGDCDAVSARLVGDCPPDVILSLHGPDGTVLATGAEEADGCTAIDPEKAPGARYADGGAYSVCVASLTGAAVPAYALDVALEPGADFPMGGNDDPDGDGLPASCDDDRDGDGVLDEADNCVDVPNGPAMGNLAPTSDGFLRDWLALAPIVGLPSAWYCLPSDQELTGGDADLAPSLGDPEGDLVWTAYFGRGDLLDFLPDWGWAYPPREVYLHAYVFSASERDVTLAIGADDGVRAWLEGDMLLDVASCQGVWTDQFQAPATLLAGWNRLTVKVRDAGGGWGATIRFFDGGSPVTDLQVSLSPDGPWLDDQTDTDGDGLGDVCDPTP